MTFKKGEKVQTEDGEMGEILFIDKNGLEAQVALANVSMKLRTDTLKRFDSESAIKSVVRPAAAAAPSAKGAKARRTPKR